MKTHPDAPPWRATEFFGDLAEECERASQDPELLALHDEIAVVDARITDVLRRSRARETGALWRTARDLVQTLREARARGNLTGMRQALVTLEQTIRDGADDYDAWDEVVPLFEQRRRIVELERCRLVAARLTHRSEDVAVLLGQVLKIVQRRVSDPAIFASIEDDVDTLLMHGPDGMARKDPSA